MSAQKTFSLVRHLPRGVLALWLLLVAGSAHAAERVTYYHNDALGSPVAATDRNGTLLWRESYAPYGERLTREAGSKDTVWYTGKQEEAAFGINYFGARWYDPKIGRFVATDPAGFKAANIQSFNKYAYANNNPYVFVDPDGRWPFDNFKAKVKDRFKTTYDMHREQHPLAHEEIFDEGGTTTVRHYTDSAGRDAITESGKLNQRTFVTRPGEISPSSGHLQVEETLEIQPGRGSNYIDVDVPNSQLHVPNNGPTTSGGAWQRQLTNETPIDPARWKRPPGRPSNE